AGDRVRPPRQIPSVGCARRCAGLRERGERPACALVLSRRRAGGNGAARGEQQGGVAATGGGLAGGGAEGREALRARESRLEIPPRGKAGRRFGPRALQFTAV